MLKVISYDDMGVVKEFTEGSHLVGAWEVTGLWPKKFSPATCCQREGVAFTLAYWRRQCRSSTIHMAKDFEGS